MKDVKSAADFYENKVNEVGVNIKDLEAIVQGKTNNVRVVEEGIIFVSVPRISNVADVIQLFSSETEDGGRTPAGTSVIRSPRGCKLVSMTLSL